MKTTIGLLGLAGCLLTLGCTGADAKKSSVQSADRPSANAKADDDDDDADEDETDLALADVPEAVKNAAIAAVPGLVLSGAEKETADGKVVYELEGTAAGQSYEIAVTADGKVTEIESGDDDDDDGDDD